MERSEILVKVQETFRYVLSNEDIILTEVMGPEGIDEWNSLAQAQILTMLEHEFDFRFTLMELMSIKTVGNIVDAISAHTS